VSLELSDKGRALMEKAWTGAQAAIEAKIKILEPRERATVTSAMTLLKGVFGSAGLGPRNGCVGQTKKAAKH
jgi:hypothetical protein